MIQPNSTKNPRGAGRKPPPVPTDRRTFRLTDQQFQKLKNHGNGDATAGLKSWLDGLPDLI